MLGQVLRVIAPNRVIVTLEPSRSVVELHLREPIPDERLSLARTATALNPFRADWIEPGPYLEGRFVDSDVGVKWTRQTQASRQGYHKKKPEKS